MQGGGDFSEVLQGGHAILEEQRGNLSGTVHGFMEEIFLLIFV